MSAQSRRTGAGPTHWSAYAAAATMLVLLVCAVALRATGHTELELSWIPSWDAELSFRLDGLAFLYVLLASAIGLAVTAFSFRYLPRHLDETGAPQERQPRFYALLVLFAVSMVGLACADDLLAIFVFWDLTAIASYFLIGYDREDREARWAALAAMLVTGITAVLLLIGAVVLWAHYDSLSVAHLLVVAEDDTLTTAAATAIMVAGLAKSAQAPLHLWLPKAMIAPTPVSAYLHSAAMVAAGVLLIGRVYPLLEQSRLLLDLLLVFGLVSVLIGGALALAEDELKRSLAYSTISQYGYVVCLYGLGGGLAAAAAAFYVVGHAIEKSALFLTAGAVGEATGASKLSQTGGLARQMPAVAVASGFAAAGIIGLPLTLGFFQEELVVEAALESGWVATAAAAGAAALTFAYMGRFWIGIFLGEERGEAKRLPATVTAPILALGGAVALGGLVGGPFAELAERAGSATAASAHLEPEYVLDKKLAVSLGAFALGAILLFAAARREDLVAGASALGERLGPTRFYEVSLRGINRLSDSVHGFEVRDLRTRVAAVLLPAGLLAAGGLLVPPFPGHYELGSVGAVDAQLSAALLAVGLGALALTLIRGHLTIALLLGATGYALALVYALFGAPDVALTAALVETVLAVMFLAVLSVMPSKLLRREAQIRPPRARWRDPALAAIAGAFACVVAWGVLSARRIGEPIGPEFTDRASAAHAEDAVTAILADFRGLDTMGEISVLLVAVIGVTGLIRGGKEA